MTIDHFLLFIGGLIVGGWLAFRLIAPIVRHETMMHAARLGCADCKNGAPYLSKDGVLWLHTHTDGLNYPCFSWHIYKHLAGQKRVRVIALKDGE